MPSWKSFGQTLSLWPNRPVGLIEIIGGSYLASNPQISYRKLIETLAKKELAIHAWRYLPGLDHQAQANQAWKDLRSCRKKLESRIGVLPQSIRMGHSLGCKLHLLAPDGGRNSKALIAISFNNFGASRSIPMLNEASKRFGLSAEFSPSPKETLRLIKEYYAQSQNILISFTEDKLDETKSLKDCLKSRSFDSSKEVTLEGDHLTPASAGIRKRVFGEWANDPIKQKTIEQIACITRDL
ncbi:DUF1350 family protein [Prochlorococcus sp. MIT 1341]|uniref:DUF1350 family protein n=1 Tax=Prochlorococcus sp. MIT 1341 TaxID=3096221 RepID=UPI002A74FD08|nr:DUF1350 family protein [Prochlorococcus sp. MIT 1341]